MGPRSARVLLGNGYSPAGRPLPPRPAPPPRSFWPSRLAGLRRSWRSRGERDGNPSATFPEWLPLLGKCHCLRGNRKPAVTPGDPVCFRSVSKHRGIETRLPRWGGPTQPVFGVTHLGRAWRGSRPGTTPRCCRRSDRHVLFSHNPASPAWRSGPPLASLAPADRAPELFQALLGPSLLPLAYFLSRI